MLTVLVTGVGGGGMGRQVIKALRAAATKYKLIGTDMTDVSMGLYECDGRHIVPPASSPSYMDTIIDICMESDVDVVIAGSEPELQVLAANRSKLQNIGVLLLANTDYCIGICMDKWRTYEYLLAKGFNMPPSWLGTQSGLDIPREYMPVVIKPTVASGGSMNVYVAQDMDEVTFFVRYMRKQGLVPMVQQYVGTPEDEYTVGVLTDMENGGLLSSVALKRQIRSGLSNRIRMKRSDGSTLVISSGISQGYVDDFPEVRHECEKIALSLKSKGPMNFQCRVHNGKVYVFEINPRFSGTTYPRVLAGYNEPDTLIRRHILGDNSLNIVPKRGLVVRGLEERFVGG